MVTDPRTILAAAGVSLPEVEALKELPAATFTVNADARDDLWRLIEVVTANIDGRDAALVALAREVARQKWMLYAKIAEECVYGERSPNGVSECDWCSVELNRLIARYAEEGDHE